MFHAPAESSDFVHMNIDEGVSYGMSEEYHSLNSEQPLRINNLKKQSQFTNLG